MKNGCPEFGIVFWGVGMFRICRDTLLTKALYTRIFKNINILEYLAPLCKWSSAHLVEAVVTKLDPQD